MARSGMFAPGAARMVAVIAAAEHGVDEALEEIGFTLHGHVVRMLSRAGSGAIYRSRGGGGDHQASAPGEPPAVDLGDYRGSWKWEVVGERKLVNVFTPAFTGPYLEFGTSRMEPRPHLRPSVEEFLPRMTDIIAKRIVSAERKAAGAGIVVVDTEMSM